jgi:hypothetical protein
MVQLLSHDDHMLRKEVVRQVSAHHFAMIGILPWIGPIQAQTDNVTTGL